MKWLKSLFSRIFSWFKSDELKIDASSIPTEDLVETSTEDLLKELQQVFEDCGLEERVKSDREARIRRGSKSKWGANTPITGKARDWYLTCDPKGRKYCSDIYDALRNIAKMPPQIGRNVKLLAFTDKLQRFMHQGIELYALSPDNIKTIESYAEKLSERALQNNF